jgi:hypothetical protein
MSVEAPRTIYIIVHKDEQQYKQQRLRPYQQWFEAKDETN